MNPFTLDFFRYKQDILDALVEVYGNDYASLLTKRFNLIYFVPYVNYEGINAYYRFLASSKSRQLALLMLKIIGKDVDKYNITTYADDFCLELSKLCEDLLGGSYCFDTIFQDSPYGFKSFIDKYIEDYSEEHIRSNRINFINAVKSEGTETITEDNYDDFVKSDEYQRIEKLATYYSGVYDALLNTMNTYLESIQEYNDYYKKELDRKRDILEKYRIKLFYILEDRLRGKVKKHVDSLETEKEKVKAILSCSLEYTTDIEYFSDEYQSKLEDPNVDDSPKEWIKANRMKFFRDMGIDIDPWKDNYEEVIEREDVKPLIIYSVFANEVTRLRKYYLEEARKEFILESPGYKETVTYFADNQNNKEAVYNIYDKLQVCVNGGYNDKQDFLPIIYYTIRNWQCGCMDYVLLHEIVHAVECFSLKKQEHGCGFEPNVDKPELSTKDHHDRKRKYERLNEVITDFLSIEVMNKLHEKGIYLLDEKLLTLSDVNNFNTSKILKELVSKFYNKYRKFIIEARLYGDLSCLTDYIGEENFEEFNDIIDSIDVLIEKGLPLKLQLEDNDNELVVEYNKLCVKLKQVYKRMGETFGDRFTSYSSGYFYRKKKH